MLTRADATAIAAELDEPHDAHGTTVRWVDPGKKKAAEARWAVLAKKAAEQKKAAGAAQVDGATEAAADPAKAAAEPTEKQKRRAWVLAQDGVRVPDAYVWTCALSLAASEAPLGDERWGAIAGDFMREMGFDVAGAAPVRWVAIHHGTSKKGNDHIHIAADLVREDGSIVDLWPKDPVTGKKVGDHPRSSEAIKALERFGLHVVEGGELPARPERVADVGHGAFDPRFVLRFPGSGRVDEGAVERGEFGVGAVDLRIVEIGPVDTGFQVVAHQPIREAAEELERGDMGGVP